MKKALLVLMLAGTVKYACYGQTTTYYHYDARTGIKTKIGESQYNENRTGFAPYYPSYDLNTYARIGQELQRRYDTNVQWIQGRIDNLVQQINNLSKSQPQRANLINEQLTDLIADLSTGHKDYSKSEMMKWVNQGLNTIQENINNSY